MFTFIIQSSSDYPRPFGCRSEALAFPGRTESQADGPSCMRGAVAGGPRQGVIDKHRHAVTADQTLAALIRT